MMRVKPVRTCRLLATRMLLPCLLVATTVLLPVVPQRIRAQPREARLTIAATVGRGFFAFDLMDGFAKMISQNLLNVTVVVDQSPNFLDTMQRVATRRADLGVVGSVIVLDAFSGQDVFRGNPVPIRTLAVLHDFVYYLVTLEDTGIRTIGDLRAKRIGIPYPGDVRDALRWLRAAGLDPERDVRREAIQGGAWILALRERRVDAVFTTAAGWPIMPDVWTLATTGDTKVKIVPLDDILLVVQKEFGPRYHAFTIPKGLYPGLTANVGTLGAGAYLVAMDTLDRDRAYQITKLFYEKRSELAQFSRAGQYLTLVGLAGRSPVPFHPGAVKYFKERGVLGF